MPVLDARDLIGAGGLPGGLDCDVVVIGTGPAGSTLARELSGTKLRVTVLESGGPEREPAADSLDDIENVGWPRVADQWLARNRIVGGTSTTWSGRCAAFDEIDLEVRPWVPLSGWPISLDSLTPFLDRSAAYLGLGVGSGFSDDRFWALAGHEQPALGPDPARLLPMFWQSSRDSANPYDSMRFGRHLIPEIGPNVTLVTGATVTRVNAGESGAAAESVDFVGPDGRRWTLPAATVVVAAGGIENARLLLASDGAAPTGLGNDHDLVGRHLMDHPRGTVASFALDQAGPLLKRFGSFKSRTDGANLFQHGLRLSPTVQRDEGLLNASVWVNEMVNPGDPWEAISRFLRRRAHVVRDARLILANGPLVVRGLKDYFVTHNGLPHKIDALTLEGMVEQLPDPDSRVTLSERRDRFGSPLARIDWRMHEQDAHAMRRAAELTVEQFPRLGLQPPVLEEWVRDRAMFPRSFVDVAHPTGTTRMAADPAHGVVDAQCRVHGVAGLYLAGSSVFPTSGHANPTQMIVALALRLADTIKVAAVH